MYRHGRLLHDCVEEFEGIAFEWHLSSAYEQRPEEDAEGVEIRSVILGHRLIAARLLRREIAERLLHSKLLVFMEGIDDEGGWGAKVLEGDGPVAEVDEAHETGVGVEVERVRANFAMEDAGSGAGVRRGGL